MDKKLKLAFIIGIAIVITVPSMILLGNFIINTGIFKFQGMIDISSSVELAPTPNSDISLEYSIQENKSADHYHYDFEFTFSILQGVEPNFTYNGREFNETQLYLSIKANYRLEFFTFFYVLNMSEFEENNSQVLVEKAMDIPERFENLVVKIEYDSLSENGYSLIIGGSKGLFLVQTVITAEDLSEYSGTMHTWINENSYNLSYTITSNCFMAYTLKSSVANFEIFSGYIQIIGMNGTSGTGIGTIGFPISPWVSPGNYSVESNKTFWPYFPHISFEFTAGVNFGGAEVEYEIIPLAEITGEKSRNLLKILFISTGTTILLVVVVLSCMINVERKYNVFWYVRR